MCVLRFLFLVVLATGLVTPLLAMNNADVIKMTEADFSEETIMQLIGKEPADFDTRPDALIEMKKAGVSEAVIRKIVALKHGDNESGDSEDNVPSHEEPAPPVRSRFFDEEFPSIAPRLIDVSAGQEYFLRSTLRVEDGEYSATNYARGVIVPINTPVKIEAIRGGSITLRRIDTGDRVEVINVEKYTRKTMTELARLLFSDQETPLKRWPSEMAASIRNGEMRKGMTKEQVLMARGYPPAHETTSTDSDRWIYWSSRFVKHTILFSDGRLVEGRGIY